jgi:hypothetical protein
MEFNMNKKWNLICILLCIFLMPTAYAAYAASVKVESISCNGCSPIGMKRKAESGWLSRQYNYAYVHVFNETDLIYKKYKVNKVLIDDRISVLSATEITPDHSIESSFLSLVEAKKHALIYFKDKSYDISSSNLFLNRVNKSTTTCEAKEVSANDKTPHDYIKSSSLRKELYYKLISEITHSDPYGYIPIFLLKNTQFFSVLEGSSNGLVSNVGLVLSILDINDFGFNTVDGGRMKGTLDFKKETFIITSAYDGDCNELPLTGEGVIGEYSFTTNSGAEAMQSLIEMQGGLFNFVFVHQCVRYQAVCTGIAGHTPKCYSICVQRR